MCWSSGCGSRRPAASSPWSIATMGPGGAVRWVHDRTVPLLSDRGEVIGHVGTVEDVTERRAAEKAVRRGARLRRGADRHGAGDRAGPRRRGPDRSRQPVPGAGDGLPAGRGAGRGLVRHVRAGRATGAGPATRPSATLAGEGRRADHLPGPGAGRPPARRSRWANRALEGPGGEACVLAIGHDITALEGGAAARRCRPSGWPPSARWSPG